MTAEPDWLTWTRELQTIAQTGLAFVRDPYGRERYEMLRLLASKNDGGTYGCAGPEDRGIVQE